VTGSRAARVLAVAAVGLALAGSLTAGRGPKRVSSADFQKLMRTLAEGWNQGNAKKAADCFALDAVYAEPPGKQLYRGRAELYEFFGGDKPPQPPMSMEWHHLVFDPETQVGSGEYSFQMNNRYHGIVIVKLKDGLIASWREYQYPSSLSWAEFVGESAF
jgi:SnoaL-like domain